MTTTNWAYLIGGGIILLIVVAAILEAYLKRNSKRRLIDTQPSKQSMRGTEHDPNPVAAAHANNLHLEKENKRLTRRL
jgi:hypothetical protein